MNQIAIAKELEKKSRFIPSKVLQKHHEAVIRGITAELCFAETAHACGWETKSSLPYQDAVEHWDYTITGYNQSYRVEVKSRKKIARRDHECQDQLIWVEIVGVGEKNKGWLNGKADLIAFEQEHDFILVKRVELITLVQKVVKRVFVKHPDEAVYKLYRFRDKEELTLIPVDKILDIITLRFEKPDVTNDIG